MPDSNMSLVSGEPTQTDAAQTNASDPPEFAFVYFAKRYVGLLATITAIPILSTAFGVLQPPDSESKLPVLTSLSCLIAFAASFQLRDKLADCVYSDQWKKRLFPFFLVTVILSGTIALTADYYAYQKQSIAERHGKEGEFNQAGELLEKLKQLQIKTKSPLLQTTASDEPKEVSYFALRVGEYLIIQPLFVLVLGILIVTSFTQNQNIAAVVLIESQTDQDKRQRLFDLVVNQIKYDRLAADTQEKGCHALQEAGEEIVQQCEAKLLALSKGCIEVPAREARYVFGLLFRNFPNTHHGHSHLTLQQKRYDAVSDRQLDFWSGKEDAQMLEQYFRLNVQAVSEGVQVSRIFLLEDDDILNAERRMMLAHVLQRHQQAGIAWAIALYKELDPKVCQAGEANDFALFNKDKVVAFYRSHPENARFARFVFDTDEKVNRGLINRQTRGAEENANHSLLLRQNAHYKLLLGQCWMASKNFESVCEVYETDNNSTDKMHTPHHKASRCQTNQRINRLRGIHCPDSASNETFLITVNDTAEILPKEILPKLEELKACREICRKWYGENHAQEYSDSYAVVAKEQSLLSGSAE